MKTFALAVVLSVSQAGAAVPGAAQMKQVELRDAHKHVGQTVTICGRVVTHHCPRPSKTTHLDLESPYWVEGVSVAIPAASRQRFGTRVEDRYTGRSICATGVIEQEGPRHNLTVRDPADIHVASEQDSTRSLLDAAAARGCDADVQLPQVISRVSAEYPERARATGRQGIVLLDGVVRADGTVGDVVVVHSLGAEFGFDEAAVRAFKQWRFKPGTKAGEPTAVVVGVQIRFSLQAP
jgi:TonB family protein